MGLLSKLTTRLGLHIPFIIMVGIPAGLAIISQETLHYVQYLQMSL